jgi:capping protein beta
MERVIGKISNPGSDCCRSPWSGEYQPSTPEQGYKPSAQLEQLEHAFNDAFATYKDLYYGGGVSSVYLWDLDQGFAGAILIKKGK